MNSTQQAACLFHLRNIWPDLLVENIPFSLLSDAETRFIVGVTPYVTPISWAGQQIAEAESLLGDCHSAYTKTLTEATDTTQYVLEAGEVKLNPSEYSKRRAVYRDKVNALARGLRCDPAPYQEVGYLNPGVTSNPYPKQY